MYLENGDEVYEADNGRFILANSGAYCDESGNPIGGCIDDDIEDAEIVEEIKDENEYVYVTKSGKTYHTSINCPALKNKEYLKVKKSDVKNRKPCKRCSK